MGEVKNDVIVENEYLFRTMVFSPIAILLVLFGGKFLMFSDVLVMNAIYIVITLYVSLSALAYAAYYTNEVYEGKTDGFIKNNNLFKTLVYIPLAILFSFVAFHSVTSSVHVVFSAIAILLALYFALSALSYAAFYTNDYQDEK